MVNRSTQLFEELHETSSDNRIPTLDEWTIALAEIEKQVTPKVFTQTISGEWYTFHWDTPITSSIFSITGPVTELDKTLRFDMKKVLSGVKTQVHLSGGTVGAAYLCTNTIISNGQTKSTSFKVIVV